MVRLRAVRSLSTCESRRERQVQAPHGDPEESWADAGQLPAYFPAFTDGTTFGGVEVYGGPGDLGGSGGFSSAEKSVIVYIFMSLILNPSGK